MAGTGPKALAQRERERHFRNVSWNFWSNLSLEHLISSMFDDNSCLIYIFELSS